MRTSKQIANEVLHSFGEAGAETQNARVLDHLVNVGQVTQLDAYDLFNCTRLSARILDLRRMGVPIYTKNIHKNGKTYAEYRLAEDAQ